MADGFFNVYEDRARAEAYSRLEFPGTYYLAYRDLPAIIGKHVLGRSALDFGCGAGRSTRFLRKLGFEAVGVDISEQMIARAKELDPQGDYEVVTEEGLLQLPAGAFDLVQSVFTFDNVPQEEKVGLCRALKRLLKQDGCLVSLVSTPEIYTHEWASFSTKDFPGNWSASTGDKVMTVMLDVEDRRPVEDIFCRDEDYRSIYQEVGLTVVQTYRPLGRLDEPHNWLNETEVAPWIVYVLALPNSPVTTESM